MFTLRISTVNVPYPFGSDTSDAKRISRIATFISEFTDVPCDNVNALLGGKLCTMRTYNVSNDTAYDIHKFVKVYCPGTCANYCDADGFGNATAAEAIARRNANKTVLVPALFDAIAQLRVRMQKEFPELRPNDIRDITTMPVSNEKVRDVAHAYEVCFGANSMCMVWSVAVSIAVPDVW